MSYDKKWKHKQTDIHKNKKTIKKCNYRHKVRWKSKRNKSNSSAVKLDKIIVRKNEKIQTNRMSVNVFNEHNVYKQGKPSKQTNMKDGTSTGTYAIPEWNSN